MDSQDSRPSESPRPIFRKNRTTSSDSDEPSILWIPPNLKEQSEPRRIGKSPGAFKGKANVEAGDGIVPQPEVDTKSDRETEIFRERLFRFFRSRTSGIVAGFLVGLVLAIALDRNGSDRQINSNSANDPLEAKEPALRHSTMFESALEKLRNGEAAEALLELRELGKEYPFIGSLSYYSALAALQSGNTALASSLADESISKRERIADSLALKAVIATQKTPADSLGDPAAAAEGYLRDALVVEPGNPAPLIELSTILRFKGDDSAALETMRRARNRLNPVDSHAVADTTIRLLELQAMDNASLPSNIDPDTGTASMFSAAYVAMRNGRFADAAALLSTAQKRLPPDLFLYLANDPALRRFKDQPELAGFFD